jgi:hypothetical protein
MYRDLCLDEPKLSAQCQQPKLVLPLLIAYWYAANAMNFSIMKLHKAAACSSADCEEADFMYATFACVTTQSNSLALDKVSNIFGMTLSDICQTAKAITILVVSFSWPSELR